MGQDAILSHKHQGSKLRIARKMSMPVKSSGRAHSSSSGVFISADSYAGSPGDLQSRNRYAYTLNNPYKYTDPSGHEPCKGALCNSDGSINQPRATIDWQRAAQGLRQDDWRTLRMRAAWRAPIRRSAMMV